MGIWAVCSISDAPCQLLDDANCAAVIVPCLCQTAGAAPAEVFRGVLPPFSLTFRIRLAYCFYWFSGFLDMALQEQRMNLTDLALVEKWMEIEKEITETWGIDANFFDTEGIRISTHKHWANRLCPEIKATDKGQSFICAVAHMNVAALAKNSREPVIEECDGGLIKMVVPIFVGEEFVGAFGACGFLLDDGEVDAFLINKITGIDEEKIESLAKRIRRISTDKARKLAQDIQQKVRQIVEDYQAEK